VETEPGQALAGPAAPHEVLRALAARRRAGSQAGARDDGLRIALAIEGGGMRGVISAGMALALDELGLVPAFDAASAISAATSAPATHTAVLSIRPALGSPVVSRLATDGALLRAALEAGRAAAHATLDPCAPPP
jgi:hypothetical protein